MISNLPKAREVALLAMQAINDEQNYSKDTTAKTQTVQNILECISLEIQKITYNLVTFLNSNPIVELSDDGEIVELQ
jgi:hypothetical protein